MPDATSGSDGPLIGVFGAGGYTGRLVVAECIRRGHRPVVIGRDVARVRAALVDDAVDVEHELTAIRAADVTHPETLRAAFQDLAVVVTTVGPFDLLGHEVLDAAIDTGTHYVDVTGEQPFIRWAYGQRDAAVRAAGIVAVPAAGFEFLPGDLLADLAAGAVSWPDEVHVAYTVPSRGGVQRALSAGTRRTVLTLLDRPGVALERGELVEERAGEVRRLAWFPRPVGPRHAAGIPGGEPISVPRHVPGLRTVRTYLAVPGWQAELLQLAGNVARWGPTRRALVRVLGGGQGGPSPVRRRVTRWGVVAEAEGTDGVARAWAYGHDPYGLTATAAVVVGEAIMTGEVTPGVLPPAAVGAPGQLLDELARRSDLRWSVARPEPPDRG